MSTVQRERSSSMSFAPVVMQPNKNISAFRSSTTSGTDAASLSLGSHGFLFSNRIGVLMLSDD